MPRICVFCGSNPGRDPAYREAAVKLGETLADRGIGLVYGGASVGLMAVIADTVIAKGGEVVGVIPQMLVDKEIAHPGLTELHVVDSMHTRKAKMADLSDGFVALPGGVGTLEELFEIWTWAQLGTHVKPVGVLDVLGFWSKLEAFLDHVVAEGFMREGHRGMLLSAYEPGALLDAFDAWVPPVVPKWIERDQT
ncbi:LOG family protein [Salinarimonas ramus]|uniref:Cytokinin riboside 5'-monophosphate phosphoribohydrolase n=1 Tax=Salinarimonas ramus TaxID=690164 RepID=A0A917Q461_9HYPH|nr:TIGR00730 family Rossman fold protein [Salinarimonas ramus]GGK19228.1 cytokinin riboside 5'-monophosphate phosphoribohydrolase [Salinarimonas ramus]